MKIQTRSWETLDQSTMILLRWWWSPRRSDSLDAIPLSSSNLNSFVLQIDTKARALGKFIRNLQKVALQHRNPNSGSRQGHRLFLILQVPPSKVGERAAPPITVERCLRATTPPRPVSSNREPLFWGTGDGGGGANKWESKASLSLSFFILSSRQYRSPSH